MYLNFTAFYFGICPADPDEPSAPPLLPDDAPEEAGAGVFDDGADGAGGTDEPAGAAGLGGTVLAGGTDEPGKVGTDEAGVVTPSMRLPLPVGRSLAKNASASVLMKNTAASAAVTRDRKLADPVAPNRLPEAPEPNAAPMSAPLPC